MLLCCWRVCVCVVGGGSSFCHSGSRQQALPHMQVRLKLLPLLLEWDVRQGPRPPPGSGVQFRPSAVRKVSTKGTPADHHQQQVGTRARAVRGWRYVLSVERLLPDGRTAQLVDGKIGAAGGAAGAVGSGSEHDPDLHLDLMWLSGEARSRPSRAPANDLPCAAPREGGEGGSGVPAAAAAAVVGGQRPIGGASRGGGAVCNSEHRSVRCSLVDAVWPDLVAAFRHGTA